jgi:CRP-like cAMP-binding protein
VLYSLSKNPETAVIPFIFLSAKADKGDVRKGMSLGADDYITKPFDEMDLLQAVESRLKKNELLQKEYDRSKEGYDAFVNEAKDFRELQKLTLESTIRPYKKRDIIFEQGHYPRHIYLVQSGKVKIYRSNEDGKEYLLNIYSTGDYFGFQPILEEKTYSENAVALEDCELCLIPKDDFLKLLYSNNQVAIRFIKLLANNLGETEEKLLHMAYNSVRKRVAQALLFVKDKFEKGNEGKPSFSLPREDLANIAGTSIESSVRALSDFKEEGLVEVKGSAITLLNVPKLERLRN